jgi:hypothetical protein
VMQRRYIVLIVDKVLFAEGIVIASVLAVQFASIFYKRTVLLTKSQ